MLVRMSIKETQKLKLIKFCFLNFQMLWLVALRVIFLGFRADKWGRWLRSIVFYVCTKIYTQTSKSFGDICFYMYIYIYWHLLFGFFFCFPLAFVTVPSFLLNWLCDWFDVRIFSLCRAKSATILWNHLEFIGLFI